MSVPLGSPIAHSPHTEPVHGEFKFAADVPSTQSQPELEVEDVVVASVPVTLSLSAKVAVVTEGLTAPNKRRVDPEATMRAAVERRSEGCPMVDTRTLCHHNKAARQNAEEVTSQQSGETKRRGGHTVTVEGREDSVARPPPIYPNNKPQVR